MLRPRAGSVGSATRLPGWQPAPDHTLPQQFPRPTDVIKRIHVLYRDLLASPHDSSPANPPLLAVPARHRSGMRWYIERLCCSCCIPWRVTVIGTIGTRLQILPPRISPPQVQYRSKQIVTQASPWPSVSPSALSRHELLQLRPGARRAVHPMIARHSPHCLPGLTLDL